MSMVSAKQVQDLRKMSGAGMMDCKNALSESNVHMRPAPSTAILLNWLYNPLTS